MKTREKIEIARILIGSRTNPRSLMKLFGGDNEQLIIDAANEHGVWECQGCGTWCGEEELHNDMCNACSCGG